MTPEELERDRERIALAWQIIETTDVTYVDRSPVDCEFCGIHTACVMWGEPALEYCLNCWQTVIEREGFVIEKVVTVRKPDSGR